MNYALIYADEKSNKFWNIEISGNEYTVTYGKAGTKGVSKTKKFDEEETCVKEVEKVTTQKRKKGYVDAGNASVSTNKSKEKKEVIEKKKRVVKEEVVLEDITIIKDPEDGIRIIKEFIKKNELIAAGNFCKQLHILNLSEKEELIANHLSGEIAFLKNDLIEAETCFLKGGETSYSLLGDLYVKNRDYTKAFLCYQKIGTYEALFKAGSTAKDNRLREEAFRYLQHAIEIGEKNSNTNIWEAYLKVGALYHPENIKLAEEFYLKSIAFENAGVNSFSNLSVLYINNNRGEDAIKILDEAIVKFPEDSTAYFNKCCFYALQNQLDEAHSWLEKALFYGYEFYKAGRDSDLKELVKTDAYKRLITKYDYDNRYIYNYNKKILHEYPEVIEDLSFYKMPTEKGFEEVLKKAFNVTEFSFDGALKTFPTFITDFKKLKEVKLTNTSIQEFPEEFLRMNLESVNLELKFLKRFPNELGRLKKLEYFQLGSFKFKEIPKEIARFSDLKMLTIKHAKELTSIHREIGSLSKLHTLEIRDTSLTNLPIEITELKRLRNLIVSENPNMKYLPEEIFTMPNLNEITLFKNGFPSTEATKVFEEGKKLKTEKRILGVFLALLQGNDIYVETNATYQDFLKALNSSVSMLRGKALSILNKQEETIPLDANSEVLVLGKFDESITAVKNKVKAMGYTVAKKWSTKTSHVLIGEKPGDKLIPLLDKEVCWITEKQIKPEDDKDKSPTVVLNDIMKQQIKTLLNSTNETNQTMAIEMIEASQSALTFAMPLFLNYQYGTDKGNKKSTLSLIKELDNETLLEVFTKKYGFKSASEKKITEYITKIPKLAGFDELEFAATIFSISGKAIDYILENGSSKQKISVLNSLITDNVLKFDSDCSIKILPEEIQQLDALIGLDVSHLKLKEFPVFLSKLPLLESVNFLKTRLRKLPKEIEALKNLKKVVLGACSFKKFPAELYQSENIEQLSFSVGYSDSSQAISEIPEGISNLKKLQRLNLERNPIVFLPNDFGELKSLEFLNLNFNKINNLPESFANLKSLKKLHFSCFDSTIQEDFSTILMELKSLEELSISTIQFNTYKNLSKITSLKKITILGRDDLRDKDWIAEGKKRVPNCEVTTSYLYSY